MPEYDDSFFVDSERCGKFRTYKVNGGLVNRHRNDRCVKDKFRRIKNVASMKYATFNGETINRVEMAVPKKCVYRMMDSSDSSEFSFIVCVCGVLSTIALWLDDFKHFIPFQ